MDLAQRIADWELQYPPDIDRFPIDDKRPWRPPSPIWAPARFPWWPSCQPSPRSISPSLPPRPPSPPLWRTLPQKVHMPRGRFWNLNLYSTPRSPPPKSARLSAYHSHFIYKKPKREEPRPKPPHWTTQLRRKATARKLAEADIRRKQREDDEELQNLIRGHLEEKEPRAIFNEDFSFGPKTYEDENDYLPPLSPHSSSSPLPDLCSQIEHKTSRHMRHDSSTADMVAKSHRDQLHSTSSPIPILHPQSKRSAYTSFEEGFKTQEVYPGQLVDFVTCNRLDAGYRTKDDVGHTASDHRLSSIVDNYKDRPRHDLKGFARERNPISLTERPSYHDAHLKDHHMEQSGCKSGLVGDSQKVQKVPVEQVRKKTCDLQRKPRTARDHARVSSDSLTRTALEESLTAAKTTHVGAGTRTATAGSSSSSRTAPTERARRRSRVPRCRSTDTFLRTIQESGEARMRTETAGSDTKRGNTLGSSGTKDTDWMGDEPL
ncbi:hypothetical protein ST47_g3845 [Ascochyta rabiei]|uniref:Uncharacterized protein n=2 Tax=Didymella rabiei TaxID=5454 RepID=A0A163GSH1_DIDRA|nr:hypothetical protein ST47_g3845 [Ascochyta rabiei]